MATAHLIKGPDTISVTATPQAITLPETGCWYSIRNSGSGAVYYIAIDISDYAAATYTSATAAALRTAGCGMVASGESTAFKTDLPTIYLVCANTVTATANIEPGIVGNVTNIEANLGNVGLLNAAETEINPSKNESEGQTIIYADINANATVAATPEEIIAAVAAKKIYVLELALTFTVQDVVRILSKTGTPVYWGTYQVASYGGIVLPRNANDKPHFVSATAAENFGIVTAATNSYSGHIIYYNAA